MSEPLETGNARAFKILGAKGYADCFALDLSTIKATGRKGQHTQRDIDQVVAKRAKTFERAETHAAAIKRSAPPAPRAQQQAGSAPQMVTRTVSEMNAELYADPAAHRALWAFGVRDMKKPDEQIVGWTPDPGPAWNPNPVLVEHADGTGHWETPQANYDQPGSVYDKAREVHKPGWTWDDAE